MYLAKLNFNHSGNSVKKGEEWKFGHVEVLLAKGFIEKVETGKVEPEPEEVEEKPKKRRGRPKKSDE